MGFVSEALTEKDKEFLESFKFRQPLGGAPNELASIPHRGVIDREQGIYLICLGGRGNLNSEEYPPDYYMLIWGNSVMKIEAYYKATGSAEVGVDLLWNIRSAYASSSLKTIDPNEIQRVIREAFTTNGNAMFSRSIVTTSFAHVAIPRFPKEN